MKKLFALLICLFMLTSCGATKSFLEENETFFESPDYPIVTYEIENVVDGVYNVAWQNSTGFPDTNLNVEIKKDDRVIYKYSCDEKGDKSRPEKVVHLFEYDGGDIYYVQNNTPSPYGSNVSKPLCFVVYDGENVPDFMDNNNSICINNIDNSGIGNSESWSKKFESASEFLHENITEQEIVDIFDKCRYDDQYILKIYNYSEKD
ncbi:MAG: hypothetical protein K2O60_09620 [Ruminococcus sp.]|nr:hypothetical protein [Ruminococcus sp.]